MGGVETERGLLVEDGGDGGRGAEGLQGFCAMACVGAGALFYALCNVAVSQTTGRVPNDWLLLFRYGGLFLGSGLASLLFGRERRPRGRGTTFWLCAAGGVSWCINVFFFEALKYAPPGVATAIVYIYPLLSAVGAACFLGERLPLHAARRGRVANVRPRLVP